jgi:hypothetical protein
MDDRPEIDLEVIKSLVQTSLVAIWERDYAQAEAILHGISLWNPHLAEVSYGYALLYQARGETTSAIDVLLETTRRHPGNDMAKSLLGFVLHQDGRGGWRELLQQVLANASDAAAIELAKTLLHGESRSMPAPNAAAVNSPLDMIRA